MLSKKSSTYLLATARQAIIHQVRQQSFQPEPVEDKSLNECSGCFVTIKQNGCLRGCIGNFQSQQPLYREVAAMAVAAASQDPRFPPMGEEELDNFSLEITVLSPLERISDTNTIKVGRDGIYIIKGGNRGVLLPQVATEYGWDRTTFLRQTCVKAGLAEDAWQQPETEIYIFSGEIINE